MAMRSVLFALSLCLGLAGVACGHERPNIFEVPKHQPGPNPFVGNKLFVDPNMHSVKQADAWRAQRPEDAALMDKIATQPQAASSIPRHWDCRSKKIPTATCIRADWMA